MAGTDGPPPTAMAVGLGLISAQLSANSGPGRGNHHKWKRQVLRKCASNSNQLRRGSFALCFLIEASSSVLYRRRNCEQYSKSAWLQVRTPEKKCTSQRCAPSEFSHRLLIRWTNDIVCFASNGRLGLGNSTSDMEFPERLYTAAQRRDNLILWAHRRNVSENIEKWKKRQGRRTWLFRRGRFSGVESNLLSSATIGSQPRESTIEAFDNLKWVYFSWWVWRQAWSKSNACTHLRLNPGVSVCWVFAVASFSSYQQLWT